MRLILLTITLAMSWPLSLLSQDAKALEIMTKANEAVGANFSYQYQYTYKGWGKTVGNFKGDVAISKSRGMKILVNLNSFNAQGQAVREESIYTDGNNLKLLDKTEKVLKQGTAAGGSAYLMSYAWYAVFREFLMPKPFGMALGDKSLSLDGSVTVAGKDCHIISTNNPWGDRNSWYIGKDDFQVYGQRQENSKAATEGGFVFEMLGLTLNKTIDDSAFELPAIHTRVSNEDERKVAVGEMAPEWLLQNAAGQKVGSNQLKGKKVILDFWASWCAPCWKVMPVIDQIKADFEGDGLAVFGINVWESPKIDIGQYLKKKQLNHYDVLIDQDASVAKSFKIGALPLVVVIDETGKIIYHNNGQDAEMDSKIRALLAQ